MTRRKVLSVKVASEQDVVFARQRTRQVAQLLGYAEQDQTRLATAVSELARNAFDYAGGGSVEYAVADEGRGLLQIVVSDRGPGIPHLDAVLEGQYRSKSGMGLGILGTRRLMDDFHIESRPGEGTRVTISKNPSRGRVHELTALNLSEVARQLAEKTPPNALSEIQQQNHELMVSLADLQAQHDAVQAANAELAETNRGVVALYAELDERSEFLRRANETKTRFLSSMTHEFRTPVFSILSLAGLLLRHVDGPLSREQEKQVRFIVAAAESLSTLIGDLLDHAKVQAGKVEVRSHDFSVNEMLTALRGTLRPLLANPSAVELIFEEASDVATMHSDERKVSQIVRNLVSNAIKFTSTGSIVVSTRAVACGRIEFSVADTGIGLDLADHERIFEDFVQVHSPLQKQNAGTGLGLPLARRLAELLGGSLTLQSVRGRGTRFTLNLPARFEGSSNRDTGQIREAIDPTRDPVLVVESDFDALLIYERALNASPYQMLAARDCVEALGWLEVVHPVAILFDNDLQDETDWRTLEALAHAARQRDVALFVVSGSAHEARAGGCGATVFAAKPVSANWLPLTLSQVLPRDRADAVLIIDDDATARYTLRAILQGTRFAVHEAESAQTGLRKAHGLHPRCIILDLIMPGEDGFTALRQLKSAPDLQDIPVLVCTSQALSQTDALKLSSAAGIVAKHALLGEAGLVSAVRLALSAKAHHG